MTIFILFCEKHSSHVLVHSGEDIDKCIGVVCLFGDLRLPFHKHPVLPVLGDPVWRIVHGEQSPSTDLLSLKHVHGACVRGWYLGVFPSWVIGSEM